MTRLEFIERLPAPADEERWLIRGDRRADPEVAWFFTNPDREHLDEIEKETRPWHGAIHPRVSQIHASAWFGDRLVFTVDDDRGPTLLSAAAQLADPIERERWTIAQIIAIADGLASMRQREPRFVHRNLEPNRMFITPTGQARLRAPVALVVQGPRPGRVGAGVVTGSAAWMSPEQARGQPLTPAHDAFALAANLYAALSGKPPFGDADNMMAALTAIITTEPAPIETHAPGLAAVLARAFAKDPTTRCPDPGTFAGELWQCIPDATDYDAVISDRLAAWWPTAPQAGALPNQAISGARCRMRWDQLEVRGSDDIRYCTGCQQEVVRATSLAAAIVPLLGRRCVAYTGGD